MKIYIHRQDMPSKCIECPFINSSDECILQGSDASFNADTWDDLKQGCPLCLIEDALLRNMVKIGGYDISELIVVASLLRKEDISEHDIKLMANNLDFAFQIVGQSVEEYWRKMCGKASGKGYECNGTE